MICTIGLQKSNYSNAYYINAGYFIRQLDPMIDQPKETDGHIRTRMTFKDETGRILDYLDLDKINEEDSSIENAIIENMTLFKNDYLSVEGLKKLLRDKPVLLYQTTLRAKSFLCFDS